MWTKMSILFNQIFVYIHTYICIYIYIYIAWTAIDRLSVIWKSDISDKIKRQCCQKRDHQKFVDGFALSGLLGSGRASMLPLGTLSLGLWVLAVDPAFIALHIFQV